MSLSWILVYADLSLVQIEGNNAKADDAIMLDKDGYVSETNATNIVSLCIFYSFWVQTMYTWKSYVLVNHMNELL